MEQGSFVGEVLKLVVGVFSLTNALLQSAQGQLEVLVGTVLSTMAVYLGFIGLILTVFGILAKKIMRGLISVERIAESGEHSIGHLKIVVVALMFFLPMVFFGPAIERALVVTGEKGHYSLSVEEDKEHRQHKKRPADDGEKKRFRSQPRFNSND